MLLDEQFDQGLKGLPICLYIFEAFPIVRVVCSNSRVSIAII